MKASCMSKLATPVHMFIGIGVGLIASLVTMPALEVMASPATSKAIYEFGPSPSPAGKIGSFKTQLTVKQINGSCVSNKWICAFSTNGTKDGKPVKMPRETQKIFQKLVDKGLGEKNGDLFIFRGGYRDRSVQFKKVNKAKSKSGG
jgi:hypothetical protein